MPANSSNLELYLLIGITAVIFITFLAAGFIKFFIRFSRELQYLNNEIRRSEGKRRKYWKRKRRKLWRSLIPFVKY